MTESKRKKVPAKLYWETMDWIKDEQRRIEKQTMEDPPSIPEIVERLRVRALSASSSETSNTQVEILMYALENGDDRTKRMLTEIIGLYKDKPRNEPQKTTAPRTGRRATG